MQAELVIGVSLGERGSKDILGRSNSISKVVGKETTSRSSESFWNRQSREVVHHILGSHFYSVGQRFS